MLDTPQLIVTTPRQVAYVHVTVPREQIQEVMGPGLSEVLGAIAAQGLAPSGPWFTHHRKLDPATFDFEICVPVEAPVAPVGRVQAAEIPSFKAVRTVYHGDYSGLGDAWGEFGEWIEAQGLAEAEDLWECYLSGPEASSNSADWRTELTRPLRA